METVIVVVLGILVLFIVFRIFKTLLKWLLIGMVVVLAIAFFSNPDESNHKKGFKEWTKNLPVKIEDNAIKVDDYKVFSVTKVKVDGKEKITGVGAFGKVWYFNDLRDQLGK
jgi:ABC-type branched-subunit amino acid transport system permease subunit